MRRRQMLEWAGVGAIVTALALVLVGGIIYYASHYVSAGPVIERAFAPAHHEGYQSYEYWYTDCDTDMDGNVSCDDQYHYVTRTRWIDDRWSVLVEGNCETDGVTKTCDHTWHDVSKPAFNRLIEGEWYGPSPSPSFNLE